MQVEQDKQIRQIGPEEMQEALALAWEVFAAQMAPQCTPEGIDEFWNALDHEYMLHRMGDGVIKLWAAFDGQRMVGMCALKDMRSIQLLFIEPDYQYQGAGTSLLKKALIDCRQADSSVSRITVEALGDSVGFFQTLGFTPCGQGHNDLGLPALPMELAGE